MKKNKKRLKTFSDRERFRAAICIVCAVLMMICIVLLFIITAACEQNLISEKQYIGLGLQIACAMVLSMTGAYLADKFTTKAEETEPENTNSAKVIDDIHIRSGMNELVDVENDPLELEYDFEAFD